MAGGKGWIGLMAFNFYEDYFLYVGDSESPTIYHRWAAVSMVAAILGRNISFPFGHGSIYPNVYCLLVGNPGARKGTALKPATNILREIEFNKLAPQRVSPERFLIEMQAINGHEDIEGLDIEKLNFEEPSEIYVVSEEFGDFIKQGNIDFVNLLTNLWDNLPEYKHPKIHGKSVNIYEPTVNIIGATTQQGIALSLPVEAIGQGFLSRFILVHGEPTGKKITFPIPPSEAAKSKIAENLERIKETIHGTLLISQNASALLDRIYKSFIDIDDNRFQHYNTRRFTHLLKLCTVFAAMDYTTTVDTVHVLQANTLLHATEQRMSKALGQFGKAKHSDVANNIMELLKKAALPLKVKDIWKHVAQDLGKIDELIQILRNLETAERIGVTKIGPHQGFVAYHKTINRWDKDLMLIDFLTPEERV